MNPKTTIGLVIALAVAVLGVWWAQSSTAPPEAQATPAPKALFDPPVDDPIGLEIIQAGSTQPLQFVKDGENQWRMTAPVAGPADSFTLNADVERIKNLKYVEVHEPGGQDSPTTDLTSLDAPLRIFKLTGKDGKAHLLKVGRRQALSKRTYVQREGDDRIYLVEMDINAELNNGLAEYRGKRVTEFNHADAVRVEVSGDEQYTLVKTGGKWTLDAPIKARADNAKVSSLLTTLSNLSVAGFVEDAPQSLRPYGLQTPRLTLSVTTEKKTPKPPPEPPASAPAEPEFDVQTRTIGLAIGAQAEDKVFAKLAGPASSSVFEISDATTRQLIVPMIDVRDKAVVELAAARVQKIVASSPEGAVELTKSGGNWQITSGLAETGNAPAEFAAVDDLIKRFSDLKAIGFEWEPSPAHGFDRPRASVAFAVEGRLEPIKLTVGGQTPSGTSAYVRSDNDGSIAVVKAESVAELTVLPAAFLSRDLLAVPESEAKKIEVAAGDRKCAVERESITWEFVSPITARANVAAVNRILGDLSNLRGRKVLATSRDAAKFGLDRPTVELTLTSQSPPKPAATTQPASAPAEPEPPLPPVTHVLAVGRHGESVVAMLRGGRTICEVDPKVLDDLQAELHATELWAFEPSQMTGLELVAGSRIDFNKQGDDWKLTGEPSFQVDSAKITSSLEAINSLRAKRFVRYLGANLSEFGLDAPEIKVTARKQDGHTYTLMVSSKGPEGFDRYAAISDKPDSIFVISAEDAAEFKKKVADFQKHG